MLPDANKRYLLRDGRRACRAPGEAVEASLVKTVANLGRTSLKDERGSMVNIGVSMECLVTLVIHVGDGIAARHPKGARVPASVEASYLYDD